MTEANDTLEANAVNDRDGLDLQAVADVPYAFSRGCTWHGDPRTAAQRGEHAPADGNGLECPHCGAGVIETPSAEIWWGEVRRKASNVPELTAMMLWSQGKCFPDFDHLQNAYRQAMEGTT